MATQQSEIPRILVVEDNDDVRQVLRVYLGANGFEVLEAVDGLSGLALAAEVPDLILLDVLLPKIDGIEVLRRLRATSHGRDLPVVMMSAVLQTRDLRAETGRLNVAGYLQKPFQLRAMLQQLREILGADGDPAAPKPRRPAGRLRPGREAAGTARPAAATAPPRRAAAAEPLRHARASLAGHGRLENTPVPCLLHAVFAERRTGRLAIVSADTQRTVFFASGIPVFAESAVPEETLGAHLVRGGLIDQVQNARVVTEMTRTGRQYGEVLLRQGLLGPHELFREMEAHLAGKVVSCFGCRDGIFEFVPGDEWKERVIIARMPPGRLILDGCRRHWLPEAIRRQFAFDERGPCVLLDGGLYDDRQLALDPTESRIVQMARKGLALSEMTRFEPHPEVLLPILYGLFVMELIGFRSAGEVSPPSGGRSDIAAMVAEALDSRPPVAPLREEPASQLMAEYLKLRCADHFKLLGVSRGATPREITAAFQERQRRYHPDTLVGIDTGLVHEKLEELYVRVHTAHRTLMDPAARSRYTEELDRETAVGFPTLPPKPLRTQRRPPEEQADPEQLFREGRRLLGGGDYAGAGRQFLRADELDPQPRYQAYGVWAAYLDSPGARRVESERELSRLRREHQDDPLFNYLLGGLFQREGDLKRAISCYESALEIDPRHIDAARQLRIIRMRQRSSEESGLFDIFKKR